jgi:hypothetical protein
MDKQREEFEAWYVKTYPFASTMPGKFERDGGDYTDTTVNVAWQAFQYAQAAQPARPVGINGLTEAETSASMSVVGLSKPKVAQPAQPTDWRELCRRLYVELFYVDQQLCSVMDENDEPVYTQGSTVRLVLKEASAALAQPAQPGLPDCWVVVENGEIIGTHDAPGHVKGIQAIRYVPAGAAQPAKTFVQERAQLEQEWCELRSLKAAYAQPAQIPVAWIYKLDAKDEVSMSPPDTMPTWASKATAIIPLVAAPSTKEGN